VIYAGHQKKDRRLLEEIADRWHCTLRLLEEVVDQRASSAEFLDRTPLAAGQLLTQCPLRVLA
jgi:hypothetical protein